MNGYCTPSLFKVRCNGVRGSANFTPPSSVKAAAPCVLRFNFVSSNKAPLNAKSALLAGMPNAFNVGTSAWRCISNGYWSANVNFPCPSIFPWSLSTLSCCKVTFWSLALACNFKLCNTKRDSAFSVFVCCSIRTWLTSSWGISKSNGRRIWLAFVNNGLESCAFNASQSVFVWEAVEFSASFAIFSSFWTACVSFACGSKRTKSFKAVGCKLSLRPSPLIPEWKCPNCIFMPSTSTWMLSSESWFNAIGNGSFNSVKGSLLSGSSWAVGSLVVSTITCASFNATVSKQTLPDNKQPKSICKLACPNFALTPSISYCASDKVSPDWILPSTAPILKASSDLSAHSIAVRWPKPVIKKTIGVSTTNDKAPPIRQHQRFFRLFFTPDAAVFDSSATAGAFSWFCSFSWFIS